jgi:hypothetical protein
MTHWMHPPELERRRERAQFDPVIEGRRHGLSRELSLAIWERVCADTTDGAGRRDEDQARRRFHEIAARMAARDGRTRVDVGRVTRVEGEPAGPAPAGWWRNELAVRTPGRETLVAVEARRWAELSGAPAVGLEDAAPTIEPRELPGAGEVMRLMAALPLPSRPDEATSPERPARTRLSRLFDVAPRAGTMIPGHTMRSAALPAAVMRSAERSEIDPDAAELVACARHGGAPLDAALQRQLEASLGARLDSVRVHTDAEADAAARALGAHAFALGDDVFFRGGAYDPQQPEGRRLIAHEVAHTVQARGTGPNPDGTTTVSQPGDAPEREADAFADAFVQRMHRSEPHALQTTPRLSAGVAAGSILRSGPQPTATKTKRLSSAAMMKLTLAALKRYADEQVDWANNPALKDPEREVIWRWVEFAREADGNLAGCGKMTVSALDKQANTDDKREALRAYGGALSGARATARIQTGAPDVPTMIAWGRQLVRLEESMGGPTLKRIVDDDAWKLLAADKALVDYTIDYNNAVSPVLDAEDGAEIRSIRDMRKEKTPYATYKAELPEVRNYHRFLDAGLKQVAANKKNTQKKKPLTLVLHSALDHNGAFHRDPNMKDVLADKRNLTLLIEGAERLDDIKSRIEPLANTYGMPGPGGKGKIDQVMIAGHGNANLIELGGKMEMGLTGELREKGEDLRVDDASSKALLEELLRHMDPSSPNHKVVFNACLTASNSVETADITAAVAAGKDPAQAVKDAMKKHPSFTAALLDQAKALGVGGIAAIGANNSIGTVPLQNSKTGALDLRDPDDPAATGTKLEYVKKGAEPLGVMRAVVESWAEDKAATLKAMKKRVTSGPIVDWRSYIVTPIFDIIVKHYPDDIGTINDFSEWAGALGEAIHKQNCRVGYFKPPASINKHLTEVANHVLTKVNFSSQTYYPMTWRQTELILGLGTADKFLSSLSGGGFTCQTADEFIDDQLLAKSATVLATYTAAHARGQLIVALLDVVRHETPGADTKAFLLAHGVKSDKLTSAASDVLAGRMSEDKVLARLGIGGKPASSVAPKANADPDDNASNELYVEPVALAGTTTRSSGDIEVRAAPEAAATSLGKLADGTSVTIVGKTDAWYAIKHDLKVGYLEQSMVTLDRSDKPVPFAARGTASNPYGADVHASADDASPKLGELALGETVTIVARTEAWFAIQFQHKTAWVSHYSVDAKKKKLTLMSAKGTVSAPSATLYDGLGDNRKSTGTLKAGDAVAILARADDDLGATPDLAGGAFFAIKKDGAVAWLLVADVKLGP